MGVQRVSGKDLIDEYLYRPPSPKQKKKLTKKSWQKSKKTKGGIWALSFCINHLHICITIADFDITESGVLIWFSWVLKSTISPLKKCKILTLFIYSGLLFGSFRSFYLYYLSSRGGRGGPEKVVIGFKNGPPAARLTFCHPCVDTRTAVRRPVSNLLKWE